jgi:undecaprenyl diphosphate synthase
MHIAIIMDGNGRWAEARNLPRLAGHKAGGESVRRVVEAAPELGVTTLTLYAFSSDNWKRPPEEVDGLMRLLREYLRLRRDECVEQGVRVTCIGRRDRLPGALAEEVEQAERLTAGGDNLWLRIALDYSSRDAILEAARRAAPLTREGLNRALGPEVDLLIRTGGEQRLSDFLLWECAYAEMYFTPVMWPEFGRKELAQALAWFRARDRRFGALSLRPATG